MAAGFALILVDGHDYPSTPHMKSDLFALFRKPTRHVFVDFINSFSSLLKCFIMAPLEDVVLYAFCQYTT
jgi:hypothetical protein